VVLVGPATSSRDQDRVSSAVLAITRTQETTEMLALVSVPEAERQPADCPTCAKRERHRANAAQHFALFEAEFGTAGVSKRQLRAVFALHADKQLVEAVLVGAWYRRLPAWRLREITKSLNPRRCSRRSRCWIHNHSTTEVR
jgi:hypothetical protein